MTKGAWTIGSYPLGDSCAKCGRRGQYRRASLLDRYGPDMTMPELRHVLAQCSRRNNASDPCMVIFPDLAGR